MKSYATYWRNSLADSAAGKGTFRLKDVEAAQKRPVSELVDGLIDKKYTLSLFKDEPKDTQSLAVTLRPLVFHRILQHGQKRGDSLPDVATPLVISASLMRDGRLYPTEVTIPRDLLEPLDQGYLAIGQVAELDHFISVEPVPAFDRAGYSYAQAWSEFCAYYQRILEKVANGWPKNDESYGLANEWYLEKSDGQSFATKHIQNLYDDLKARALKLPLFERYASERTDPPEPCLPKNAGFAKRLAHSSDKFELAEAQRDVLSHVCVAEEGEIIAVNGPPGTGKTTVLLSVIATLWAKAAIEGKNAPVIVAASANNQAVTNIIDAFGKDFATGEGVFAGRWLPDVKSFGVYLPSQGREAEAAKKYQTEAFFRKVESQIYVEQAQTGYLAAGLRAFPDLTFVTVEAIVAKLQASLRFEADKLNALETVWRDFATASAACLAELGADPIAELDGREQKKSVLSVQKDASDQLVRQWEQYQARESILYPLFSWIPVVATKRLQRARVFLRDIWPDKQLPDSWASFTEVDAAIKSDANQITEALYRQNNTVLRGQKCIAEEEQRRSHWYNTLKSFDLSETVTLNEAEIAADKTIRFKIFQLTTHYWEGRWLLEMQRLLPTIDEEQKKRGRTTIIPRWQRRMMLTPCAVSTLAMLPKNMSASKKSDEGFSADYLYNFIDLLIVDEAGQVLPEVAGASFSLAKQALVIGDMRQIEPIWSIPQRIDRGNLRESGVVSGDMSDKEWERLAELGKLASSGSVMQIAQNACRYHYDPELERGLYLYEHRRCLDEIVNFCNELSYQGRLLPRRETPKQQPPFRPMAYQHIDGLCVAAGTSNKNDLEAETIAAWLAANKSKLEAHYGKDLREIVGVITPFAAQTRAISKACQKQNIATGRAEKELTVGTVHSFQGAERPVIIFSPVYSKHRKGGFLDQSKSMLNVAVSRAKDSFLVFGDMDMLLSSPLGQPSRLLASYLLADLVENDLKFPVPPRADLHEYQAELTHLLNAIDHDNFLLDALTMDAREIHIVSPWMTRHHLDVEGYLEAFKEAAQRGVKIHVYTEPKRNADNRNNGQAEQYRGLKLAADELKKAGVELIYTRQMHSKIVLVDECMLCVGSFNWFSAAREGNQAFHETSLVYTGSNVANEINVIKRSIKSLQIEGPT